MTTESDAMPVQTGDGRFSGLHLKGVCRFAGIPYAEPAVGPLRYRPPRAAGSPCGLVDATRPSPLSLQSPSRLRTVMGDLDHPQSEDCLALTVWTPAVDDQRRPVLFWLHGGAFLSGGGALDWYDGATLCREGNVVVVSPNYRLGALGFMYCPGLSPGNLGLLDAEQALTWVRENIAQFGGHPDQITLMGQSAGAWLAPLLVARMSLDKLAIRSLILHSAPIGMMPTSPATAQAVAAEFLNQARVRLDVEECVGGAEAARVASGAVVLQAQGAAIHSMGPRFTRPGHPPLLFGPVADGVVLPELADYGAYLVQAAGRVPVLIGWTRDEMNAFSVPSADGAIDPDRQRVGAELFSAPSLQWAGHAARQGQAAFVFCFDWAAPGHRLGACHCIDLPFVFGTAQAFATAPMLEGADADQMNQLSRRMRAAWLAFTTHGNPNAAGSDGLPPWPVFTPAEPMVMHINLQSAARPCADASLSGAPTHELTDHATTGDTA